MTLVGLTSVKEAREGNAIITAMLVNAGRQFIRFTFEQLQSLSI
jgi:hypothetical protein